MKVAADKMTNEWVPALAALAPESGCYMNEVSYHFYLHITMSLLPSIKNTFFMNLTRTIEGRSSDAQLEASFFWRELRGIACHQTEI